jgi:hypothetical protein
LFISFIDLGLAHHLVVIIIFMQLFVVVYRESLHGVNPILHYIARGASFSSFSGQNAIEFGHACSHLLLLKFVIVVSVSIF